MELRVEIPSVGERFRMNGRDCMVTGVTVKIGMVRVLVQEYDILGPVGEPRQVCPIALAYMRSQEAKREVETENIKAARVCCKGGSECPTN